MSMIPILGEYDYDQLQYDQFYEEIFGAANKIELEVNLP